MRSWLDLRRLHYFKAIAEAGSITGASRQLRVAQPALTHHLRELERDHGKPLFQRSRSGVELTESGRLLLHHANIILRRVQEAEEALQALAPRGHTRPVLLRFAIIPSLATKLTPRLISSVAEALPNVTLRLSEAYTRESHEFIENNTIDLALNIANDEATPHDALMWEDLLYVASPRHPTNVPGPIRLEEVMRENLVLPSLGKPVRDLVEIHCRRHGLTSRVCMEIDGLNPRKQAVLENLGATLLPWVNVADESALGQLVVRPIVEPRVTRLLVLEMRPGLDPDLIKALRAVIVGHLEVLTRYPG